MSVADTHACQLGEGVLWHPLRKEVFWFDIPDNRLLALGAGGRSTWTFSEPVSAAGWIDESTLLIASKSGLRKFDIASGGWDLVSDIEAENQGTRSNDGRADPQHGFWIGTMGLEAEVEAGAIYRYYRGEVRRLFPKITIPNAISFSPDGTTAYFADTARFTIFKVALDSHGWPVGDPVEHVVVPPNQGHPDGAVVDAAGNLFVAMWGSARINKYDPLGNLLNTIATPAVQPTCPGFGGEALDQLYVASAAIGLARTGPEDGCLLKIKDLGRGQAEHQIIL